MRLGCAMPMVVNGMDVAQSARELYIQGSKPQSRKGPNFWILPKFVCVCVCAEWQNTLPPQLLMISTAGGARGRARLAPTKTFALACDINLGREIDVPVPVIQSPFGPLLLSCVLHVEPCNFFDTRGKPSALRAETHRTRDLSVVLETHQLNSRLVSCTRKISTLPWELKCDYPSLGEPRVHPSCDPGPARRKI